MKRRRRSSQADISPALSVHHYRLLAGAVLLLALSLLGIVLSHRYLRKPVQSVCVVLCVLLAVACAAYIGLTILFVDAVQNQPPVS